MRETRDAGRQLATAVQAEAKRWKRFATQRSGQLRSEAQAVLSLPGFERTLLTQVDGTLRAIDARVRARLAEFDEEPRKVPRARAHARKASRKPATRTRKSKQTLPDLAA